MTQDLLDDVWCQIAENWLDKQALQAMSSTSRRMHRLVVPVLFRHLEFRVTHAVSESLIVKLVRSNMRAQFLFDSPGLLRHARAFAFCEHPYTVELIAESLALHQNSEGASWRNDAENFVAVLHDTILRLIFRMPGLRYLHLRDTVMTPLSYAAISSRPLLTSFRIHMERWRNPDITYVTPKLPFALRLREFDCHYNTWTGDERSTDPYIADILDHYILELEKLALSSILLPLVVSHIPSRRTLLSLQSLSVRFPLNSSGSGLAAAVAFFQVLHACPQLRHLTIQRKFPDFETTHYLPPPSLPNLTTFYGHSHLLQFLSQGTNLVKIDICNTFYIGDHQSLTQVILSPPTHLRELSVERAVVSQTPHELLTFIRSLAVFQNLERLNIPYELYSMSWKDHVSVQDSHDTIRHVLHHLPCLRLLDIHTSCRPVDGYDIGCPISKQGDPLAADRGHPSLETIYVDFICDVWSWDSRTGWERVDWAIPGSTHVL